MSVRVFSVPLYKAWSESRWLPFEGHGVVISCPRGVMQHLGWCLWSCLRGDRAEAGAVTVALDLQPLSNLSLHIKGRHHNGLIRVALVSMVHFSCFACISRPRAPKTKGKLSHWSPGDETCKIKTHRVREGVVTAAQERRPVF